MPELVAIIRTTWPKIRIGLHRRDDSLFQFIEEGIHTDEQGNEFWSHYFESGLYHDIQSAKNAMIEHYCLQTEDEFRMAPDSITVLDAPDFPGSHHAILVRA